MTAPTTREELVQRRQTAIRAMACHDSSSAFEMAADYFYEDTGMLAIGKDQSAAMGNSPTYEERSAAWRAWRKEHDV